MLPGAAQAAEKPTGSHGSSKSHDGAPIFIRSSLALLNAERVMESDEESDENSFLEQEAAREAALVDAEAIMAAAELEQRDWTSKAEMRERERAPAPHDASAPGSSDAAGVPAWSAADTLSSPEVRGAREPAATQAHDHLPSAPSSAPCDAAEERAQAPS